MMDYRISIGWFLLIALLVHIWVGTLPIIWSSRWNPFHKTPDNNLGLIELESLKDLNRQLVQTSRLNTEQKKKRGEKARFLGKTHSRVQKETKSPRMGRFRQGRGNRIPSHENQGKGERLALSDLMDHSASPDKLPEDIVHGSETLLNTDSFVFASFINRVADEVYDSWVSYAGQAVNGIYFRGRQLGARTYVTRIAVVMDREGSIASIRILKTSGVRELDEAPKNAFWDSEPFPNPPGQMFTSEELVRFVFEFHFEWKKPAFNIVPLI